MFSKFEINLKQVQIVTGQIFLYFFIVLFNILYFEQKMFFRYFPIKTNCAEVSRNFQINLKIIFPLSDILGISRAI